MSPELMAAKFVYVLVIQSKLCDDLEAIADDLPNSVDSQFVLRTAQRMLTIVRCAHDFEEGKLFPFMESRTPQLSVTLERLRYEHWGDEEFAVNIYSGLREFVRLRDKTKVDSLAWMLRGFFDGMRRHIAFDREYILPKIEAAT